MEQSLKMNKKVMANKHFTKHQFLEKYPIAKNSKKLIVGTIHPEKIDDFKIPFFYGNRATLWNILDEAFPNELKNTDEEFTLQSIQDFLIKNNISVTDIIMECYRIKDSAQDEHLIDIVINLDLKQQIQDSCIEDIYFTSGFGKNAAFNLFNKAFLQKRLTKDEKKNRMFTEDKVFERPITYHILFSPSGSSNIGISKSKLFLENKHLYKDFQKPVKHFKIDYYKNKFSK